MLPDTRPGTVIAERFVIEELAGAGGMGEVFRARDTQTGQRVALKLLHAGAQSHVERFAREARLLAQLEHPAIVRYVAHGDAPLHLAMEWLEGEDLGRRLARTSLGAREAIELTRRIAEALQAAHRQGVIHRDIKPSNIFLCGGSINAVKLLDFGVARALGGTRAMTVSGQVLGTIGYMAPEQAREGRDVRAAVDVFSLGCVLFECLAGRPAYPGDRLMAVLAKILFADTPRVSDVREDVPAPLDELVLRMMQRRPEDRPTIPALIAELDVIAARAPLRELAPRPRAPRRPEASPAITDEEQRLVALVLAEHGVTGRPNSSSPTLSLRQLHHAADELARRVAPFGGRPEMLSNGAQLVVLRSSGAATDLAARAARCALAMRDLLPKTAISVAIGRGEPSAGQLLGEVATRAEKLLELSTAEGARQPTPSIRIDSTTAGLLDARFDVRGDAASLELEGERADADPVRELLGKPSPFVGRTREVAMLEAALEECIGEPIATAVVVTAPTGAGKSRLFHELSRTLDPSIAVWLARGDALASGSSFGLIGQLVRSLANLIDGEPDEVRWQKLSARVARHLPDAEVKRVAEFLGEIVSADYPDAGSTALRAARQDAILMGEQMLRAWHDFVAAECAASPVLIVLDDLHWGDLPSVRFIDAALRALRSSPLMVLALARPDVHDVFPGLFGERRAQTLRLPELTPRAARELIVGALGADSDPALVETLVERAGGNPLYLEELIRAVAEGRAGELPETVIAMAQARLEQLEPGPRRLLRAASVFGTRFWIGGVAALLGEAREQVAATLDDLAHREIVVRAGISRFAGEEELAFRHVVLREAAYGMLTERDRQLGHRLAGAWLEAAGERDAMVMAEHLDRGGEPGGAVVWYLWAAEQALEGNDLAAVLARAQRGVACGASGSVLAELLLLQAEASGWGARTPDHARLAGEALALLPPGSSAHARAAAELAVASCRLGDPTRLERAASCLASDPSTTDPSSAEIAIATQHALAIARTVIELFTAGQSSSAEPLVALLSRAAPFFDEDAPLLETTRAWVAAAGALFDGRPEPYLSRGRALADAFDSAGRRRCAAIVELHVQLALSAVGADADAVEQGRRTIERATAAGLESVAERARAHLAVPLARRGALAEAEAVARACVRVAASSMDRVTEAFAQASLAAVRLFAGDAKEAEERARDVVSRANFPPDARAEAFATLALALLARGEHAEAVAASEHGIALGSARAAARLSHALVQALEASGAHERARAVLGEAVASLEAQAEALGNDSWRASFVRIPEHRALLDHE